jgi:hypothetical protein
MFPEVASFLNAAVSARGYKIGASSQAFQLILGECPPVTARQVAKPEISDTNANEIFNAIANGFEHTANLTIDSLSQDNAQADG